MVHANRVRPRATAGYFKIDGRQIEMVFRVLIGVNSTSFDSVTRLCRANVYI